MKAQDNSQFLQRLMQSLGPDEGRAVYREICREMNPAAGISNNDHFPEAGIPEERMEELVSGIESGFPLQYLFGKAYFMGLELAVNPSVLIPRPETEELVDIILRSGKPDGKKILDLCTGSGCIALALAVSGNFERVEGLDVSPEALETAHLNACKTGAPVSFFHFDLLKDSFHEEAIWDIWVSNPPYVATSESRDMDSRVLHHEPAIALFVPDDDALCFYRRILALSENHLQAKGEIFLEINPLFAMELQALFESCPWMESANLLPDMSAKQRFLYARKK
jgi:release factor glutamine methyltransferase